MLIGWKATKANRNTQHKRHELKQYTHIRTHILRVSSCFKKGHLHKQLFCTASSHYKTDSTVMATSQPLLRICFCRNAYITQTYTGRLTSTPHRLKANTFYKIATKHIGNVRAKCNVDAGNSWFIMTRAHWRICHAFSTISTISTRATALVLGREAGTMEQLPAVNHTYNLSNEQAKKKNATLRAQAETDHAHRHMQSHMTYYMLFSRVNACPIVHFFHMTSSQRKTPPVHVTSHSECIFDAATRLALGSHNLYYNIIQPTITNRNSNSSNTATFGGDIFFKNFCSLGCSEGNVPLPPRPDTQLSLEPAEQGQQAISLDDICRLPRILRAQHAFTHTRMYTQKNKKRMSTRLAPLPQLCAEAVAGDFGSKRL